MIFSLSDQNLFHYPLELYKKYLMNNWTKALMNNDNESDEWAHLMYICIGPWHKGYCSS